MGKYNYRYGDDREIKASGAYDLTGPMPNEEDYYVDDFEEPTRNTGELEEVIDNYRRVLSGDITLPGEKSLKHQGGSSLSGITEASSADEIDPGTLSDLRNAKEK